MTVERLYDLYYIKKHIERIDDEIKRLEESAGPKSPDTSGMPRNPSPVNKLDEIVPKILDKKAERDRLLLELEEIEAWIHSLRHKDQLIIRYRYEDKLKWEEVAIKLGESVEAIRSSHYRCLEAHK